MTERDSHADPPSKLNSKRLSSHVSALERAFGDKCEPDENDPESLATAEELKRQVMKDREEFIKLYQPAAMNYARGVLVKLSKRWSTPVNVNMDVPAVWSNLVLRLLDGKFTSFKHQGIEGSFRVWLRRVIANECKGHLKDQGRVLGKQGPKNTSVLSNEFDSETFDPDDRTLETTLRGTLISKTYETMDEAGLYGEAVLFWEKRNREINETKAAADFADVGSSLDETTSDIADKSLVTELAGRLTEVSGKPISLANAKKYLERGKDLFARNFIDHVAKYDGMFDGEYDVNRIEETLVELEFLDKQMTSRKGVGDTQFSRRLRRILSSFRDET